MSELDFTKHFSAGHRVPEPDHNAEALRRIDALGMIGEASLKTSGFYARVVSAQRRGRARAPGETVVLIVEDDQTTGTVIEAVLQKFGYRTRHARNRAEIGAGLAAKPMPDLVLLDVLLPDVNGFDVLNRIRQHAAVQHLPVLMLTSLSDRMDIAKGLGLGADGYLTKPAQPSTLIEAIQAIVG
ncbi:MAG TPA: response regulator [Burkholderiales bacterium]|nr:response regulator [Burkholderiales bacterium]